MNRNMKMKSAYTLPLMLSMLASAACAMKAKPTEAPASFELPSKESPEAQWWRDSQETLDQRLAWYRDARFGMFVHWGVYSHLGNVYKGQPGGHYGEHIQRVLKIPIAEYRTEVAANFYPDRFDADEWIRLAAEAGMKYFIITAKHHDGFAMWPSKVDPDNIADATQWDRDPMMELKQACKKYGLKFGFYYSHAFDWGEELAPGNDWDFDNPGGDRKLGGREWWKTMPGFYPIARTYVDTKSIPQIMELLSTYDPDIMWFDTPHKLPPFENFRIMKAVREAAPNVVINGRLIKGWGDYANTSDRPARFKPYPTDWEGIPTTNESYSWSSVDDSHKPAGHFIQMLPQAVARGGNVLMNVGPMGNGVIDPKDVKILKGIGAWWKCYGESIRGAGRSALPVQTWGESTLKGKTLYLHVFHWPENGELLVGGLKSNVQSARLLCNTERKLSVAKSGSKDVLIKGLPTNAPHPANTVIALQLAEELQVDDARLIQPEYGTETLHVFDGTIHGGIGFGGGKSGDDYTKKWDDPATDAISWKVRLEQPVRFNVLINYDASEEQAGGSYEIIFGEHGSVNGNLVVNKQQDLRTGTIDLPASEFEIIAKAKSIKGREFANLRNIILQTIN